MRALHCQTSVLPQAAGSALGQLGGTRVLAAVYGPQTPQGARDTETNLASVVVEYRQGLGEQHVAALFSETVAGNAEWQTRSLDRDEHRWSLSRGRATMSELERVSAAALARSLECVIIRTQYPGLQIRVHVWLLEEGGSSLALATTVAWVACLDADIALYDALLGISVSVSPSMTETQSTPICKPLPSEKDEQTAIYGYLWLAILPNLGLVADMRWRDVTALRPETGELADSLSFFAEALHCAQQAAAALYPALRMELCAQLCQDGQSRVRSWFRDQESHSVSSS